MVFSGEIISPEDGAPAAIQYFGPAIDAEHGGVSSASLGAGQLESRLAEPSAPLPELRSPLLEAMRGITAYHFDDTSALAGVRRKKAINDNQFLRPRRGESGGISPRAFLHPSGSLQADYTDRAHGGAVF